MAEENDMFPGKKPTGSDQTAMPQVAAEEQAGGTISPMDAGTPLSLEDQPTAFIPPMPSAPAQATMPGVSYDAQASYGYPQTVAYAPQYAQPGNPQDMYQQPPGSLPLQPGQPGLSAPPRKRYTWLWVLLVAVVGFLLSGGIALAIVANLGPGNTPTQALQHYCDGYMTANAQEVYDTLSTPSKAKNSLADIQESIDQLKNFSGLAKLTACTVSDVQQNSSGATGTVTLTEKVTFGNLSVSVPIVMGLVLENNMWKIDVFQTHSNFLFPTPSVPPDVLTPGTSQQ